MIPNNNLSILPWYTSTAQQNARRWWLYNRVYPLYVPAGYLPPFQFMKNHTGNATVYDFRVYKADGTLYGNYTTEMNNSLKMVQYTSRGYDVHIFGGQTPFFADMPNGQYYCRITMSGYLRLYSEIFTVVNDIEPYLKLEWWDLENFLMDAGTIVYSYAQGTQFKNILYLPSDIAKPEYIFEEEGENRDGYFYPSKQISEKRYRFNFLAPEYLLDVLRFVRMADFAQITYRGQIYSLDTFLMTPEWESNGDVAKVQVEFDTATVAKKLGVGYIKAQRGDFNDDFNADFNNQ